MDSAGVTRNERRVMAGATAAIAVLVALQAPGRIIPETKFAVTFDPIGYLARAVGAWDPSAGFGRVQNQAIGYVFPMGAFSAVGQALAIPPWMVQRAWIALIIVASLWGAHRLARAIGLSSPVGRVTAAAAYALAPATMAVTAFQSAGQLPYALAPWVMVPLVSMGRGDDPRRVAARSTVVLVAMGGVNAASTVAVLPLVAVWFLTREPGRARRVLAGWWTLGAAAATLWWLVPLLVSVRYGVRFTDFTESASITTVTESATEVLRGTGNWLSFLTTDAGLWLPGGWQLSASRLGVAATVALAGAGLWGLARRDAPGRGWLLPALVVGAVAMGAGYAGTGGGPTADAFQRVLDGPLAPFRNVHKFAAVMRLPLAIGLGHAVAVAAAQRPSTATRRTTRNALARTAPALGLVLVVLAVVPAARGDLAAPGSFDGIPAAWDQAARWIDEQPGERRALLVPGSAFAEYDWGRPLDEPMSALARGPWAVRDLIPLGGNGSTRLLDGVDEALSRGTLPAGFASTLGRAGVGYLVVRNDLDLTRTGGPHPARVRRTLATDPSLELSTSFGPVVADAAQDVPLSARPGDRSSPFRSIDIYTVAGATDRVAAYPAAGTAAVSGGPEGLLALPPEITDGRATVIAVDAQSAPLATDVAIATDTARRRDVAFGAIRDNVTYTLETGQASPATAAPPQDRWPAGSPTGLTVARLEGAATLTESTRRGASRRPEWQPFAAFDGNPRTAWVPGAEATGEWLQVRWADPQVLGPLTVQVNAGSSQRITELTMTTDDRSVTEPVVASGTASFPALDATTRTLRITIAGVDGERTGRPPGIAEVQQTDGAIARPLVVPDIGAGGADVVALTRDRRAPFDTDRSDEDGVLDREIEWRGGPTTISGTATAEPGEELDELTTTEGDPRAAEATASSSLEGLPAFGASAAVDGDPATTWISAVGDARPELRLQWTGPVPVDSVFVQLGEGGERMPTSVVVSRGDDPIAVTLDADGRIDLPSVTTDRLTLAFPTDAEEASPVAVAEVSVGALAGRPVAAPDLEAQVDLPCGEGPAISVDGTPVPTRALATRGQLLGAEPVDWVACDDLDLQQGTHRITASTGALIVDTVLLEPAEGITPVPPARSVTIDTWTDENRRVTIEGGEAAVVATTENVNDGWEATLDGEPLEELRLDGWRQGWLVPAGSGGTIEMRFTPGGVQRVGALVGLALVLVLATTAARRPRAGRAGEPMAERRSHIGGVMAIGCVVTGFVLAGPVGGAAAAALVALPVVRSRIPWIIVGATTITGAVALAGAPAGINSGAGTFSASAQVFATIALVAAAASLVSQPEHAAEAGVGPFRAGAGSTPSTPDPSDRRPSGSGTTPGETD